VAFFFFQKSFINAAMCCRLPILWLAFSVCLVGCAAPDEDRWRNFNEDGVHLFAKGDYPHALETFNYALLMRPQDPVLLFNAGQCHERLGNVKKAEELYAYCVQRDAKHGDARLAIVSLQYRTNRVAEANQQIADWLKKEPYSADAHVADAWRLRQEKAYPQAAARLQQAHSLDKQNRRVLTEMAMLHELQGQKDRALVLYEQILVREPHQIEIRERAATLTSQGVRAPMPN
jgi:tetratricopeptide (TPR) repeat protein